MVDRERFTPSLRSEKARQPEPEYHNRRRPLTEGEWAPPQDWDEWQRQRAEAEQEADE